MCIWREPEKSYEEPGPFRSDASEAREKLQKRSHIESACKIEEGVSLHSQSLGMGAKAFASKGNELCCAWEVLFVRTLERGWKIFQFSEAASLLSHHVILSCGVAVVSGG